MAVQKKLLNFEFAAFFKKKNMTNYFMKKVGKKNICVHC